MGDFKLLKATKTGSAIKLTSNEYSWDDGLLTTTSLGNAPTGMSPIDTYEYSGNKRDDLILSYSNGVALYGAAGTGSTAAPTVNTGFDPPVLISDLESFSTFEEDRTYVAHGDLFGGSGEETVLQSASGELFFVSYDSANQQFQETESRSFNTSKWTLFGAGDLDKTNDQDELAFVSNDGAVALWKISDTGTFNGAHTVGVLNDLDWKPIAIADITGDAVDDIVFAHATSRKVAYWEMDEFGRSQGGHIISQLDQTKDWQLIDVTDLDGDDDADMLFVNPTDGQVAAWKMELGRVAEGRILDTYDPSTTTIVSGHLAAFDTDIPFVTTFAPLVAGTS